MKTTPTPKILIGEDEQPMAKALELKLTQEGFEVKLAYNGAEVLESLNNNKFDLLLLDIIMPKLDGFAVLAKMKEENFNLPVFIMSNLSQEEDRQQAKDFGVKEFFNKNEVSINEVVEFIKDFFKK